MWRQANFHRFLFQAHRGRIVPPSAGLNVGSTSSRCCFATLRRRRPEYGTKTNDQLPTSAGMTKPLVYEGKNGGDYADKASLSPWTPIPESAARRIFDVADAGPDDVHVELGCGDGRVNFFAIEAGVKESIGFDSDENILKVANERLERIYPQPNLSFLISDLKDHRSDAWKDVKRATILTMYFATEGLEAIRPMLEACLAGRRCKVFLCGYEMPQWNSQYVETVLSMPIYMYDWNNPKNEETRMRQELIVETMSKTPPPSQMNKLNHGQSKVKIIEDPWEDIREKLPLFDPDYFASTVEVDPFEKELMESKWITEKERQKKIKEKSRSRDLGGDEPTE